MVILSPFWTHGTNTDIGSHAVGPKRGERSQEKLPELYFTGSSTVRFIFILLFLVISASSWFLYDDENRILQETTRYGRAAAQWGKEFWYDKEVVIRGLSVITEEEVNSALPMERSTAWWLLHTEDIRNKIRENALIQEVDLQPCSKTPSGWGCFILEIKERVPGYVVFLGERPWLVGADGGFLYPLPQKSVNDLPAMTEKIARVHGVSRQPKIVRGLFDEQTSPDIAKGRIEYVRLALDSIESESGYPVSEVVFSSNGELRLKFQQRTFKAVFDFTGEDFTRLKEESRRLKRIVEDFRGDIGTVDTIDLAFNRLAVIKLKK